MFELQQKLYNSNICVQLKKVTKFVQYAILNLLDSIFLLMTTKTRLFKTRLSAEN